MISLFVPSSLESLQYKAVILSLFSFALFMSSSLMKRDFLNSYYTIFPFPFPVLIYAVFRYLLNPFCYLFLGYPPEYRFHFFSAYIVPFHDNFCGWVLSGGSSIRWHFSVLIFPDLIYHFYKDMNIPYSFGTFKTPSIVFSIRISVITCLGTLFKDVILESE